MSTSEQLRIPVQSILQHLGLWEEAGLPEGKNWNLCLEKKQHPDLFCYTDSSDDKHSTTGPKKTAQQDTGVTAAQDHAIPKFPAYLIGDNTLAAVPLASMTLLALAV